MNDKTVIRKRALGEQLVDNCLDETFESLDNSDDPLEVLLQDVIVVVYKGESGRCFFDLYYELLKCSTCNTINRPALKKKIGSWCNKKLGNIH